MDAALAETAQRAGIGWPASPDARNVAMAHSPSPPWTPPAFTRA